MKELLSIFDLRNVPLLDLVKGRPAKRRGTR